MRAVHETDDPSGALLGAPPRVHIERATPQGDARLRQQLVLPLALLLASCEGCTVHQAREALRREPRVSRLLHALRGEGAGRADGTVGGAEPVPSPSAAAAAAPPGGGARMLLGLDVGTTSIKAAAVRVVGSEPPASLTAVGAVQRTPLGADRSLDRMLGAMVAAAERCARGFEQRPR